VVAGDKESGNWGTAALLGNPSGSGNYPCVSTHPNYPCFTKNYPGFTLKANTTAAYSAGQPFSEYRHYNFVIDGFTFRNLVTSINASLPGGAPQYSLEPSDYQLGEIVMNPELYIGGDRRTPPPFAHLALSFRNLSVVARQARDVRGYIDGIVQENGSYFVAGWACAFSVAQSIPVQLWVGNAPGAGGTQVSSATANLSPTSVLNYYCGTNSVAHQFRLPMPASLFQTNDAQPLFVRGMSPIGLPDLLIARSGQLLVSQTSARQLPLETVYRFVKGSDRIYSRDPNWGTPFGYARENAEFKLSPSSNTNLVPIFACRRSVGGAHFLSANAACEGQQLEYLLGYASKANGPGMRPLYRFGYAQGGYSITTGNVGEGVYNGLNVEQILGYVW
jgi:hypothetical protein